MRCSLQGCRGDYEQKEAIEAYRKDGKIIVVDRIPALVCSHCGDTAFTAESSRAIDAALQAREAPDAYVPVYDCRHFLREAKRGEEATQAQASA